jgi:hypothetical protein
MTEREKLIEVMARAIVNAHNYLPPQANHGPAVANAVLDAIERAGYVVCRAEPQAWMVEADDVDESRHPAPSAEGIPEEWQSVMLSLWQTIHRYECNLEPEVSTKRRVAMMAAHRLLEAAAPREVMK